MLCYVTRPDAVVMEVEVEAKANGEDCLNQVKKRRLARNGRWRGEGVAVNRQLRPRRFQVPIKPDARPLRAPLTRIHAPGEAGGDRDGGGAEEGLRRPPRCGACSIAAAAALAAPTRR